MQAVMLESDRKLGATYPHRQLGVWTYACNVIGRTVSKEDKHMLWTIFLILLVLWFLGLVTSYTFGGFVHILLVIALVVLVVQLIQGRRVV